MANQQQLQILYDSIAQKNSCKSWNQWRQANWGTAIDLQQADLEGANLRSANLSGVNLQHANLQGAHLFSCDLKKAKLNNANLREATLVYANLQGAELEEADLSQADCSGANLSHTLLSKSNLGKCELVYSNLQHAQLMYSNCRGANFAEANLKGSNFYAANLQRANLEHALCQETNLLQANLTGANTNNFDLKEALLDIPQTQELAMPPALSQPILTSPTEEQDSQIISLDQEFLLGSKGQKYYIEEPLKEGGMALLYKGTRASDELPVVIKFLPSKELNDTSSVFRFIREGRTLLGLNHENIVKGLDFQHTPEHCFCVMEYVAGPSIREMLEEHGPLPPLLATNIVWQISKVLICLEEANICHRDIKPDNMIWCQNKTVKLVDFGLVLVDDTTLTKKNYIMGTPDFISPEQLAGETLDIASDIYSLGVSYYEMVTGSRPFRSRTLNELSQRMKKLPVRADLIKPEVPEKVALMIEGMMQPKKKKRITSAHQLHTSLGKLLQHLQEPEGNS